jgi:hypothetical protein
MQRLLRIELWLFCFLTIISCKKTDQNVNQFGAKSDLTLEERQLTVPLVGVNFEIVSSRASLSVMRCNGSAVGSFSVLTAAHCVVNQFLEKKFIVLALRSDEAGIKSVEDLVVEQRGILGKLDFSILNEKFLSDEKEAFVKKLENLGLATRIVEVNADPEWDKIGQDIAIAKSSSRLTQPVISIYSWKSQDPPEVLVTSYGPDDCFKEGKDNKLGVSDYSYGKKVMTTNFYSTLSQLSAFDRYTNDLPGWPDAKASIFSPFLLRLDGKNKWTCPGDSGAGFYVKEKGNHFLAAVLSKALLERYLDFKNKQVIFGTKLNSPFVCSIFNKAGVQNPNCKG